MRGTYVRTLTVRSAPKQKKTERLKKIYRKTQQDATVYHNFIIPYFK
jgi:hypothetical protein